VLGVDAIGRVLERVRRRREAPPESDYDLPGAEKEKLGAKVLRRFEDLVDDPENLEGLRLFLGANVDPIRIHSRKLGVYQEEWSFDGLGRLVYEFSGPVDGEAPIGLGVDAGLLNRRIILCSPSDFRTLGLESVVEIHRVAGSEDFFEKLAWIYGRCGKPGFSLDGFEEERATWRLLSADPEDLKQLRGRRRRCSCSGGQT